MITKEALIFLAENRVRNSRDWYNSHKDDASRLVIEPLKELVVELTPFMLTIDDEFITEPKTCKTISRIVRDTRYTKDKSLYRENMWIMFMRRRDGDIKPPGFYFDMSLNGFDYGIGFTSMDKSIMDAMRELIMSDDETFLKAKAAYEGQNKFIMDGDRYKKPKYTGKYSDWLNMKDMYFHARSEDFNLMFSDNLAGFLMEDFAKIRDIYYLFLKAYIMAKMAK